MLDTKEDGFDFISGFLKKVKFLSEAQGSLFLIYFSALYRPKKVPRVPLTWGIYKQLFISIQKLIHIRETNAWLSWRKLDSWRKT